MIKIIKRVLNRHRDTQGNIGSEAFRDLLAVEIAAVMKSKGCYTEYGDSEAKDNPLSMEMWKGYNTEKLSKEYLDAWTCDHCGKHTHKVEYDYLGNGTNHLQCELELETKNEQIELELK
jgi:hypothetical protein|tara:strand:+ start:559 stop:915 length:357 start_codon:yes stop_codon:yes gene_type:complete